MIVQIIKFVDKYLGNIVILFLSIFGKKSPINKPKSVAIIQLWGIGETILTLPAIKALSKKYDVTVLATKRNIEVFKASKLDIKIKKFPVFKKFDLVIDMEEYLNISAIFSFLIGKQAIGFKGRLRENLYTKSIKFNDKKHNMETFLDLARVLGVDHKGLVKLNYSNKDQNNIKKYIKGKTVGIVPGAAESAKSRIWPYFSELCNKLPKEYSLILIGAEYESHLQSVCPSAINTIGKLTLSELFCLIDKIDLVITNDTGPLHIASAQNTKTIGLFGPNHPDRFGPLAKDSISLYSPDCKYSPCINVHKGKVPDCLKVMKKSGNYQHCMKQIKVKEVLKKVHI